MDTTSQQLMNLQSSGFRMDVTLISIHTPHAYDTDIWTLSIWDKWKQSHECKADALQAWNSGDVELAIRRWERCIDLLQALSGVIKYLDEGRSKLEGEEAHSQCEARIQQEKLTLEQAAELVKDNVVQQLLTDCRLNYAAGQLKLGTKLKEAVDCCSAVLASDPNNLKALFRRGVGYTRLGRDLDLAKTDLSNALTVIAQQAISDEALRKQIESQLRIVKMKENEQTGQEKAMYGRMFL